MQAPIAAALRSESWHLKGGGRDPRPLVDSLGRIFAVLAGQPSDPSYATCAAAAFTALKNAAAAAQFPADMRKHRRGLFAAINVGLSYGKGQSVPSWLHNKQYDRLADSLLADPHLDRMATYASAAFALWAPRLHAHYRSYDAALRSHLPHLRRPFTKSVFSCAAFNFGPNIWTFKHRDVLNLAFGWCAVQALGRFNPRRGGHLVLWDLKLIIEFPPGALILLPSATVAHSNIPVEAGEERASFTQFSAGGLFRFVDNGFRTEEQLREEDPVEYERIIALKESRWEAGLSLFSTLDELVGGE
ncbi:hypothetical protein DFH06DRAFT_1268636 [Mycena polygramma]|nr:hypothetical protein DFH06DRAFT_1268636 [Mycena polygramma]